MKINHTKNKIHVTFYISEVNQEEQDLFFEELKNNAKSLYVDLLKIKKERESNDSTSTN